ncbi:MAG: hypothetical protein JRJ85_16520 [Deltaproteobacteria bacterium]|nr:hypothetical protein [Deltaproteobacteria bacterium]
MPTMLQRGFGWGADRLFGLTTAMGKAGGLTSAAGSVGARQTAMAYGARGASVGSQAFAGIAGANRAGARAVVGGVAGGTYGAFSENTSIMGGAAMGAGLFAGAPLAVTRGGSRLRAMGGIYGQARGMGMGRGQAAWGVAAGQGRNASQYIGNTANRALGRINSSLKAKAGF